MKYKKKNRRAACVVCVLLMILMAGSMGVYATELPDDFTAGQDSLDNDVDQANEDRFSGRSPWLDNADETIYSDTVDAADEVQDIEPGEPGMVEKYLSELIRNAASSLISLMEKNLGAGLDHIIYGRVGSGKPNSVNIFAFELRSGNPYGVTASICYTLIRSMSFVFLGIGFVYLLAKSAWTGQTAQSREKVKAGFYSTAMKFAVLTLMPYVFDVVLYARDVALYGIKSATGEMITGGATLSLAKAFLINAERTGRFIDSLMYLGTVLLTLYFAVLYVALAIDLLICFVAFPIMCLMHSPKRDLLGNWMMNVLSDILTPVLDAVLLLVPLLASMMLADVIKGIAIIQMIMCMLIIPSRNRIKVLLGVQSNERGGLFGIMALATLGRALTNKAKSAFGRVSDIHSDLQKSKMHKELAESDEEERESLLGGYSQNGESLKGYSQDRYEDKRPDQGGLLEEVDSSDLERAGGRFDGAIMDDGTAISDYESGPLEEDGFDETEASKAQIDKERPGIEPSETPAGGEGNDTVEAQAEGNFAVNEEEPHGGEGSLSGASFTGDKEVEGSTSAEPDQMLTKNETLRKLDRAMEQKQDTIDGLRAQKAHFQSEEKRFAREKLEYEQGSEEKQALEKRRADAALRAAQTEQKIAGQMQDMNMLRNQAKAIRGGQGGAVPSAFDDARSEIICKRANINNFEQPEFRNALSNEQLKKLYRQRAVSGIVKGTASVAGGMAGAAFLGGGSIFMQPSTAAMAAAAGALGGAAAGNGAAGAAMTGAKAARNAAGTAIMAGTNTAGSAADIAAYSAGAVARNGRAVYNGIYREPVVRAAASADFKAAYGGADVLPVFPATSGTPGPDSHDAGSETVPPGNPEVRIPDIPDKEVAAAAKGEATLRKIRAEIERDSTEALKKILTSSGELRNSAALIALKNANIETEKYRATVRETQGIKLTQRQERTKRIELQTEYMTEEVMKKLSLQPDYEKGTERYYSAKESIREKIRTIIEKQNKDIF